MKRIIFSSVCAVALFSVNAHADWASDLDRITTKTGTLNTALKGKLTSFVNWDTAFKALDENTLDIIKAKEALRDGQDKLATLNKESSKILGEEVTAAPAQATDAKTFNELLAYYKANSTSKATEKAALEGLISNIDSGVALGATTDIDSDLSEDLKALIASYTAAQTAANGLKEETLKKAVTDEEAKTAGLQEVLNGYEARLNEDLAKNADQSAKLNEYKEYLAMKLAIETAKEKVKAVQAKQNVFTTKKDELKVLQDALGKNAGKDSTGLYSTKYLADEAFAAGKKALGNENDAASSDLKASLYAKFNDARDTLLGKAPTGGLLGDEKTDISKINNLEGLKAYYSQDGKDTDGSKVAAINKLIEGIKAGKTKDELIDSDDKIVGTEIKFNATDGILKDDMKTSTIALNDYNTALTNVTNKANELKDDGRLGKAVKEAQDAIDTNTENQKTVSKELAEAKAELAAIKAEFNSIKADTLKGKEKSVEINKNLGADLAGVAGGSVKQLAGTLIDDDGDLKDVKAIKTAANAKNATDEQKEAFNEIQAAANAVAGAALEGKKEAVMSSSLGTLNVQINNMNKRLGEIRGLEGEIGAWFRAYGGRYSTDNDHFNYYSTQIGADKITNIGNGDLIVGALFGFDKVNADTSSKTYSFGGYLSYVDNGGFFADTVLKFGKTKHSKDGYNIKNQNIFLASFEGGYRVNVSDSFYVEPSLELITGRIGKYEAKTNNTTITVDSFTPFVIKPQVFAGYSVNDFILRVGGGYVYNSKRQDATLRINEIVKDLSADAKVKLDKNNYGFASIGGSYKFTDNLRLNLGVERSFGGKLTQDYELNATIRYTF